MTEIQVLWAWLSTRVQALREQQRECPDRGDGILVWVVMTALLVAAALAIVAIIIAKAKSTANNTNTQ